MKGKHLLLLIISAVIVVAALYFYTGAGGDTGNSLAAEVKKEVPMEGEKAQPQVKAEMVLLPAGEFIMGLEVAPAKKGEKPKYVDKYPHKVYIDSFYMDKYEVTNAQYFKFCKETGGNWPEFWGLKKYRSGLEFPDHPVIGVSQFQAAKYAKWRGARLPTEAEWEYAARGGLVGKKYPNGDEMTPELANFGSNLKGPCEVGRFPPNAFGLYDMAGNVREHVSDYYDKEYYKNSPYKNPQGPETGQNKIVRGGGWHSGKSCVNLYSRVSLKYSFVDIAIGFRCVKSMEPAASR
ncbi:MAG: formylglycine-generating enzyme family protein [bacterium]|nr:formylglycine-generating enzyme family protein [bacterium]